MVQRRLRERSLFEVGIARWAQAMARLAAQNRQGGEDESVIEVRDRELN